MGRRNGDQGETKKRRWLSFGRRTAATSKAKSGNAFVRDEQQAVLFLMLIMIAADGEVADNELKVMAALTFALPVLDRINESNIAGHLEHFALIRKTMSAERLTSIAVSVISESLYPAAYAAVVEAAVADSVLEDAELAFLDQLKKAFKLESFTFQAIEYSAKIRYQVIE